jgi:hypothetical protein
MKRKHALPFADDQRSELVGLLLCAPLRQLDEDRVDVFILPASRTPLTMSALFSRAGEPCRGLARGLGRERIDTAPLMPA